MDDGFGKVSFEYCKVGDVLLVGLDFTESRDVVDDAVDPHGFDVGNVTALDLVGNVVVVTLPHLLLTQNLRLELLLVTIR